MIVGAAVCPGAPFLIPGVADPLALARADLVDACRTAVRPLADADRIVVVAGGRRTVVFPAGTVGSQTGAPAVLRSDLHPPVCRPVLPVGAVVGQALLERTFPGGVPVPVDLVETGDDPDIAAAAVRHRAGARDALLVIADGAATHDDHSPGRRDDRAGPFDDALAAALAAGDPAALADACADGELAAALLAVTGPLRVLAGLTSTDPPVSAELLHRAAPYGVGYLVAAWRWPGR
ncbi:hypothetical protein [Nakamurella sp.]|uniref:hypothetical protein n=1 Tax=Nakamurella sp. TaxID=1869182 RepID=UPI003B3BD878